jgi:hypothetical protein
MNKRQLLGTSLLVLFATAAGSALARQDKGAPPSKPGGGQATPASAANPMMAKWKEFGTPGAAHKVLDALVGKWNVDVKMFEPGQTAPMQSKGTSEVKWILDGRFVEETANGDFMGEPFHGVGTVGYDNLKKKYVMSWVDNTSTGVMYAEGTYDAATKTFTWGGECPDVMAGKYTKSRTVEKMTDADHWSMQSFKPGPDGKEFMAGQLDYTRAK